MSATQDQPSDSQPSDLQRAAVVEVRRTIPAPVARVWHVLSTRDGAQALLGAGAPLGGKGEPWSSPAGPRGVVRSFHPGEQLRVSWHETPDAPATLVELDLEDADGATRVDLHHQRLEAATPALEQQWTSALERLEQVATGVTTGR